MERPRIALLAEALDFEETYSDAVWRSADARAQERNADLVVFVGRRLLGYGSGDEAHNRIFGLALKQAWSGVVVVHQVYQHLSPVDQIPLIHHLSKHTCATTSVPLGKLPVVGYENRSGMRALLRHLIRDHGKKRLLFVTGPMSVGEAKVRAEVWHEVCQEAGLPHGPEWVISSDFNPALSPDTVAEVTRAYAELCPDAIVVSSDLTAAALLRELPLLGIRIPQDVAVTGYDDIPLAGHLTPPLTTVRQPISDQIAQALDLALDGTPKKARTSAGQLIIRRSCGCPSSPSGVDSKKELEALYERSRHLRSLVANLNLFAGKLNVLDGIDSLAGFLSSWLPRLGMNEFSVSLSCNETGKIEPWTAQWDQVDGTLLRWTDGIPALPSGGKVIFPAVELAPEVWWKRSQRQTSLVLPLGMQGVVYGVLLLAPGPEINLMAEAVQELLGSFLDQEHRLKQEMRNSLEARLGTELEAEKSRTLGVLVAGFSHDLATPFSVGRDSIHLLHDDVDEVLNKVKQGILSKHELVDFLDRAAAISKLLISNWDRATELVDRFKRIGTEVPRGDLRQVSLADFMADLMKTLEPLWRRKSITVDLVVEPDLIVQTQVSALVDIVTNLVQNCLVHGFSDEKEGHIRLTCQRAGDDCLLLLDDDGVGVPAELTERIFDPYMTTKEGLGGTGLGLAVVRQRTQGLLNGSVVCEASPLGGARFIVRFPRIVHH